MKISELINYLENIKNNEGDIDVVISYRDSGGKYKGYELTNAENIYVDSNLDGVDFIENKIIKSKSLKKAIIL